VDTLWTSIVNGLHSVGIHLGVGAANAAGGQVGAGVGEAASRLDMPGLLALAAALGWASGFRLYAVVFIVGMAGWIGWMPLPSGLQVLQHPALLATSGALLFVEFFADKIPGLDSLWDMLNSVIRIPAGAALAAGALGADGSTMALVGALLGGSLAATAQAAKTTTRAAINLAQAARASAFLEGRDFVAPDDVKGVTLAVCAHRLILRPEYETTHRGELLRAIIADIPLPLV